MQTITKLFKNTFELQSFVSKLEQIAQINQALRTKLDSALADNCKVSNLRNGILILTTSSPAWNHKLRFQSIDLLSSLRADPRWSGLKSIEVRVDYLPHSNSQPPAHSQRLSSLSIANAKIIKQTAAGISHQKLADSLKRLAKHSK